MDNIDEIRSALAIQCLPFGVIEKEKIYDIVHEAIMAIDASGLSYTVGPFETVIEGPLTKLLEVAGNAHKAMLKAGVSTCATYMKLWSGNIGTSEEKTKNYRARGH
ncbi:MAG TPA: thiamine-binding protein [Spirochaetia bacterium]|nr:thiamine-binding protein [Spirochaetales bacterium]HRS65089.1 thiamine-binding protein [Spirochaetia bacterium]HOT60188.1 thiamine-binding protein [Spirochaetales bacterium]HPD80653.1 thiamine-binding protein [Spirochaetales bacterium]HQK33602.1 thiamine-binding protein [Spirochaetales bacterium]